MARNANRDIRSFPGFGIVSALSIAFLYGPITFLVIYSFNSGDSVSVLHGFSLRWYRMVAANSDIQAAAINSLIVATVAASVSVVLATGAALATTRSNQIRGAGAVLAILTLPLMVPEIVTAVATLVLFVTIGFKLGLWTVLLAHIVFCIPFAYLPLKARLEAMDESLETAAADLYATEIQAFRFVTLPLLLPGLLSGFLLAFIISLDDFIITSMVAGPSATTLPVYIYSMLRIGMTPQINAVSTLLIIVSTVIVLFSALLGRTKKS